MRTYTTLQDERLDRICKRIYGTERQGTVESVLAVNPGLSAVARKIPLGTVIKLPELEISSTPIRKTVRLWGES